MPSSSASLYALIFDILSVFAPVRDA
jgi:hypothetical protein